MISEDYAGGWWARCAGETARHWADRILGNERTNIEIAEYVIEAWRREFDWLITSMERDGIPEYVRDLVITNW